MRKFLLFSMLFISVMGQSQVQIGVFGGSHLSSVNYQIQGDKQKDKHRYGYQAGINWKIPVEGNLYFSPAAFYSRKGYNVKFDKPAYPPGPEALTNRTTFHTVELAFMLQHDFSNMPDHFFFRGGPSLDFHLFGREKFDTDDGKVKRNTPFGYDKYGRYAANFIMQAGYEAHNDLFFFIQYTYGLASINNKDEGPKIRHRLFGISVGKYLGKGKPW